ncbi:MAG: biotin--[acetyl-CoA-carboxylase] ligase [Candidatus Eremiobacteraeota bacterium]|nr:biotin--[acetyl-CoA-carboxylase] ligase [Candidatus Eremiobacteraeota bacterium]
MTACFGSAGMSIEHPFAALPQALAGSRFADVRFESEVTSTNELIAPFLGNTSKPGVTIVADLQRRGVGRKGREWIAARGSSLLFTTALPVLVATKHLWAVPFWSALALRNALRNCGIAVRLQWPNDILSGTGKLCGILCVSRVTGAQAWVGCGVGLNVNRAGDGLAHIVPPPAFVSDFAEIPREKLLEGILRAFDASLWLLEDPQGVARAWERAAGLPGAAYRIQIDGEREPFDGVGVGLGHDGALIVETNGAVREISLADARVLR